MRINGTSYSNFTYANQGPIGLVTMGLPLVATAAYGLYKGTTNFEAVKSKFHDVKKFYADSSKVKVVCSIAAISLLAAGAITAGVYLLPTLGAISVALVTITLLGDILMHPQKLTTVFSQRENETKSEFRKRLIWNIFKTTVAIGLTVGAGIFVNFVAAKIAAGVISKWNVYNLLPSQTHLVVFLEYAAVGVGHLIQGVRHWRKGDKKQAMFHFTTMAACFLFPTFLLKFDPTQVRLHHAFIGLAMSLCPYRPVQFLGTCITVDSFRNIFTIQYGSSIKHQYDFMNVICDTNLYNYIFAYSAASCIDQVNDHILRDKEKELHKKEMLRIEQ